MNKLRRKDLREITDQLETLQELLDESDAVYVVTSPDKRAWYSQKALEQKKHVLCESPVALGWCTFSDKTCKRKRLCFLRSY